MHATQSLNGTTVKHVIASRISKTLCYRRHKRIYTFSHLYKVLEQETNFWLTKLKLYSGFLEGRFKRRLTGKGYQETF